MVDQEREEYLSFAMKLARAAERKIMPHFRRCAVSIKPDGTEVTAADREAEEAIRERLVDRYPDHDILGEEFGQGGIAGAARQWLVDPLDGTASFTLGIPLFGTLIALLEEGDPVVGVIHMPAIKETLFAARGGGCWYQEGDQEPVRVRVDPVTSLDEAYVATGGLHGSEVEHEEGQPPYKILDLVRAASRFRFVTDCLQHGLVCRGRLHVAVDTLMAPWDIGALVPCVEEAGGIVSNLTGQRENVAFGGSLISSASQELHEQALKTLQP
ncbi:Histidinol-phosphatase [Planctomycetes bacterium Pan216]|uniref:Histidinol-phosphatase n=1 Tax=Kolteria novifilia TaxID=2527975 RepID=A0A518B3Q3_9BACT|nr:Histidinol-phosphatase [Planctomycetes bacterium Pan216]